MNPKVVNDYAALMREGCEFPPAVVFDINGRLVLVDGHHRHAAASEAGRSSITAIVKTGSKGDAVRYAITANLRHGCRLTNADKRRAVAVALQVFPDHSNRAVAAFCAVSDKLVGRVRLRAFPKGSGQSRRGKDGKLHRVRKAQRSSQQSPRRGMQQRTSAELDMPASDHTAPQDSPEQPIGKLSILAGLSFGDGVVAIRSVVASLATAFPQFIPILADDLRRLSRDLDDESQPQKFSDGPISH